MTVSGLTDKKFSFTADDIVNQCAPVFSVCVCVKSMRPRFAFLYVLRPKKIQRQPPGSNHNIPGDVHLLITVSTHKNRSLLFSSAPVSPSPFIFTKTLMSTVCKKSGESGFFLAPLKVPCVCVFCVSSLACRLSLKSLSVCLLACLSAFCVPVCHSFKGKSRVYHHHPPPPPACPLICIENEKTRETVRDGQKFFLCRLGQARLVDGGNITRRRIRRRKREK